VTLLPKDPEMTDTDKRPSPVRRAWRAFRSAITGKFVSRQFADEHPEQTVSERRKR